ncbi:hypothetical protein L6272_02720, partial [Microgenomates group bacterium]|nr:hypothetical protein [Microgenomates group bacterium]
RLLAFAATFVAFFSGSLFYWLKNKLAAAVLIVLIIALNWQYFRPEKFSPVNDYYYTDRQRIANEMSGVLSDYLPKTAVKPEQPRDINGSLEQFDFPTVNGKTPLEFWSDIISLLSWLGLLVYAVRFYRTRA